MARTFGASTTEKITVALYTAIQSLEQRTVSCWFIITGNGNTAAGRLMDRANVFELYSDNSTVGKMTVEFRRWVTNGKWSIDSAVSQNVWHHIAVTYDYALTTNDPIIYIDGVSVAITENGTPAGGKVQENVDLIIGNRASNNRSHEGDIAECAWWNRILSADEIKTIHKGGPMRAPIGLVLYMPIYGHSPEANYAASTNGTVSGSSIADHAPIAPSWGFDENEPQVSAAGADVTISGLIASSIADIANGTILNPELVKDLTANAIASSLIGVIVGDIVITGQIASSIGRSVVGQILNPELLTGLVAEALAQTQVGTILSPSDTITGLTASSIARTQVGTILNPELITGLAAEAIARSVLGIIDADQTMIGLTASAVAKTAIGQILGGQAVAASYGWMDADLIHPHADLFVGGDW